MPNEPWVTQENGVDTVTVTASRLSPIYIHGGGGGIAGMTATGQWQTKQRIEAALR